jgi:hypothetical protein
MSKLTTCAAAVGLAVAVSGCGVRRPVVYHDQAYTQAGPEAVEASVEECMEAGETYGARTPAGEIARDTVIGGTVGAAGGAVGGAIWGSPGRGAAAGAAGGAVSALVLNVIRPKDPSPAFKAGVERCLRDRGYQVIAWQ